MHLHCTTKAASQSGTNYTNWKKKLVGTGWYRTKARGEANRTRMEWKISACLCCSSLARWNSFSFSASDAVRVFGRSIGKNEEKILNLLRIVFCRVFLFYTFLLSCCCVGFYNPLFYLWFVLERLFKALICRQVE